MTALVITGIGRLVSFDPEREALEGASLVCVDGSVTWAGSGAPPQQAGDQRIDAGGRCVVPGFVDSHTHLVFAGDRLEEFAARLAGRTYDAGGINATVAATRRADRASLLAGAQRLASEALSAGTTTLEVKSGYGLTVADEQRLLDVAGELVHADTTFLGAHVVPPEYAGRADDYVHLVCGEMLDACAPLASWCDVFCERGAFDADHAAAVLRAGARRGLGLRIHANQLAGGPGVRLGLEYGAASVDHCSFLDDGDVDALAGSETVATLLPAAEWCTQSPPAPARRLLDAGARIALATDCNPGTSYTTSMPFVIALACARYRLSPSEALRAATLGGAHALRNGAIGHLRPGARADLVILDAPHEGYLAYRPGVPQIHAVVRDGSVVVPARKEAPP